MTFDSRNATPLSDEEFCDRLLSRGAGETSALSTDDADAEAESMKQALSSYRTETLHWAEHRSATMPLLSPAVRRRRWFVAVPQWSMALVAAAAIALSLIHRNNAPQETAVVEAPAAIASSLPTSSTPPQELAQDNDLLTSIDDALNDGGTVPAESAAALGLQPARGDGSME